LKLAVVVGVVELCVEPCGLDGRRRWYVDYYRGQYRDSSKSGRCRSSQFINELLHRFISSRLLLRILDVGNLERRGYRSINVVTLGVPRGTCVVSCRCGVQ
jgi:hypothetical protein